LAAVDNYRLEIINIHATKMWAWKNMNYIQIASIAVKIIDNYLKGA
jgi:hypothetical protein